MMAAMEFAALVFQGKLPPLLAADDSSQSWTEVWIEARSVVIPPR
jgi:hypothetical protein